MVVEVEQGYDEDLCAEELKVQRVGGCVSICGKLCVIRAVKNCFLSVGIMRSVYTALRPCA